MRSASTVTGIQRKRVVTTRRDPDGVQTSQAIATIAATKRDKTEYPMIARFFKTASLW
jgi:hypothetical protein